MPELDDIKKNLRSILAPVKEGVLAKHLDKDYRTFFGGGVPYSDLGYNSLQEFIRSIPDTVNVSRNVEGTLVLKVVHNEATAHIGRLIAHQKSNKKASRGKPAKLKPNPHRPAWSKHLRHAGPQRPPRFSPWRPPARSYYNNNVPHINRNHNRTGFSHDTRAEWNFVVRPRDRPEPERYSPVDPALRRSPVDFRISNNYHAESRRPADSSHGRNFPLHSRNHHEFYAASHNRRSPVDSRYSNDVPKESRTRRSPVESRFSQDYHAEQSHARKSPVDTTFSNDSSAQRSHIRKSPVHSTNHHDIPAEPSHTKKSVDSRISNYRPAEPEPAKTSPVDSRIANYKPVDPKNTPPDKSSRPSYLRPAVTKDYRMLLGQYLSKKHLPKLEFDTVQTGSWATAGFVSSVTIEDKIYGSLGIFRSKREAEAAVAKTACEKLLLDGQTDSHEETSNTGSSTNRRSDSILKKEIEELLMRRPNGLWNTRLAQEYEDFFKKTPPSDLMKLYEGWTDILKIDSVVGTDKKIIFPMPVLKIPDPILPLTNSRVKVEVVHTVDPFLFYVHLIDGPMQRITSQLQTEYSRKDLLPELTTLEVGTYCIAQHTDDCYYRGQLISTMRGTKGLELDISYIDYGNFETVLTSKVYNIQSRFCQHARQAIPCRLQHAYPIEGKTWNPNVIAEFEDVAQDKIFFMDVIETNKQDNKVSVQLTDVNNSSFQISDHLVKKQLALRYDLPVSLKLPESNDWEVYISYVNTTTDVCMRLVGPEYSIALEELEEQLSELENCSRGEYIPEVNQLCAIRTYLEEDDCYTWYRGRVISITELKVEVYFLDYGDTDIVEQGEVRPLPAKFLQLPFQAINCKLTGLESFEKDLEVSAKLSEMALGMTCVAEINDRFVGMVSVTLWETSEDPDVPDVNINEKVAEILKDSDLSPRLPARMHTVECYASCVTDSGSIYLQIEGPGLKRLEELREELMEFEQSDASSFVRTPTVGQLYVARNCVDSMWYRARVEEIQEGRKADVFYIDYGNRDTVPLSSLRSIDNVKSHLLTLPYQAVECAMYGLPPKGLEWTPASLESLADLLPPDELRIIEVVVSGTADELPQVEAYWADEEGELIAASEILLAEDYIFRDPSVTEPDEETNYTRSGSVSPQNHFKQMGSGDNEFEHSTEIPAPLTRPANGDLIQVSWADDPHNFRIRPVSSLQDNDAMMERLHEEYESLEFPADDVSHLQVGSLSAAKHDGAWYRVLIQQYVPLLKMVKVYFVDYGDCTTLEKKYIQPLSRSYRDLPFQAIKVKLHGVKPTQDDWSETAREKFQELVTEQVFSVWFQDEGEHDMASVILIDSQSGSNAFIHTTLINDGVAARTTAT